eukprot:m.11165 g.11165  ORF g.11165 m.11165 type:complete len:486 (+) comp4385_c0_seq1:214-1671(+)
MSEAVPVSYGPTSGQPEEVGISREALSRITTWQVKMVEQERLPMTQLLIQRKGKVVYNTVTGWKHKNTDTPKGKPAPGRESVPASCNNIYRMYSMTKPIVTVAAMMLVERGEMQISDPVYLYLGDKWKKENMKVYLRNTYDGKKYETTPCLHNITIKMLMNHTSGLSYGFDVKGEVNQVDKIYYDHRLSRDPGIQRNQGTSGGSVLQQFCDDIAELPLLFQPGEHWWYSFATDVLGRVVEVASGTNLEDFLQQNILKPLKMVDTSFGLPQDKRDRFCSCYMRKGQKISMNALGQSVGDDKGLWDITEMIKKENGGAYFKSNLRDSSSCFLSGGGGLVGTCSDYMRFCACMINGGELDGVRILSRKTVQYMTVNHLGREGGEDLDMRMKQKGLPMEGYSEAGDPGTGFGLGFSVTIRPDLCPYMQSKGTFSWGGAASTLFFIDPVEDVAVVFASQFRFRDDLKMPLRATVSNLVYGCIVDGTVSKL